MRSWFRRDWDERIKVCPTCMADTRLYKRPFHNGMVRALILLRHLGRNHTEYQNEWVHVSKKNPFFKSNPGIMQQLRHLEYDKLKHWDMIETYVLESGAKSGFWKLTDLGHEFLEDAECRVVKRVWLVHDKKVGQDGGDINAREALGIKFDFDALMNSTWGLPDPEDE